VRRSIFAVGLAALVLLSAVGPALAAPGLNFTDDRSPNPYVHSDTETISAHDLGEMDSPLELYDDEGEVTELPATYNQSQDTPFGVRWDNVEADAYRMFPRVDGETDNGASWTETGQWTTGANAAVSEGDANGVEKVTVDATGAGGNATFAQNVSISSDADKRVAMAVMNVDSLGGSAEVQLRFTDGDGDYRYANISSGENANDSHVIANSTGNGYVFQERLSNLPMAGSGDDTLDGIQRVEVVSVGDTSKVTIAGLDVERKSTIDFGTIERDTDSDGDLETHTFEDYYEGGVAKLTEYEFGSQFDSATLHDFEVYDVRYQFSDLADSDEYSVEFRDSSDSSYANELEIHGDIQAPNYIDLSHGTLEVRTEQGLIADRYGTVEIASDVADDTAIGDLNESDYTSKLSSMGEKGDEITLLGSATGDTTYRVHMVVYLKSGEVGDLQASGAMGPTGSGGGFFSTFVGQVTGLIGAVVGFLGLRRFFGGS
jgi:hypothetical protein